MAWTLVLDPETEAKVLEAAAADNVSPEEYCAQALRGLLNGHDEEEPELPESAYAPLLEMAGFIKGGPELDEEAYRPLWDFVPAKGGPTDSSFHHDVRPGDPL